MTTFRGKMKTPNDKWIDRMVHFASILGSVLLVAILAFAFSVDGSTKTNTCPSYVTDDAQGSSFP